MRAEELPFELAAGSIMGLGHLLAGRNNQDSYAVARSPRALVAVVADGCGSCPRSEVGAVVGSRLVVEALRRRVERGEDPSDRAFWRAAQRDVVSQLWLWVASLGGEVERTVEESFLFTVVGALLTPEVACVFSVGDGVWALNGQVHTLGPFPHNAPPYLAYNLLPQDVFAPELLSFQLHALTPTPQVEHLLVGTDGLGDLTEGREPAAALEEFWREERYFRDADAVRRRLVLCQRAALSEEHEVPEGEEGVAEMPARPLTDDTTLVVVRRTG